MPFSDSDIQKLMHTIGSIETNLDNLKSDNARFEKKLDVALNKAASLETKINKHTTILSVFGAACLFFKEKILGILNI